MPISFALVSVMPSLCPSDDARGDDAYPTDRAIRAILLTVTTGQDEFDALLAEHRRWTAGHGGRRLDLTGRDLTGLDLRHAELIEAILRQAILVRADLAKANLAGADLTEADLTGARLLRTDLTEAVLTGARLDEAELTKTFFLSTDLRAARLRNAKLDRVGFDGDQVEGWDATGATGTVLTDSTVVDATGPIDALAALRQAGANVEAFTAGRPDR